MCINDNQLVQINLMFYEDKGGQIILYPSLIDLLS